ncbi:MAG: RelA/SpoT domain-containing protein [Acidobacteriota bacterium]
MTLEQEYARRYEHALQPAAVSLQELIVDYLTGLPRIDRVTVRAKSVERFLKKAEAVVEGEPKYSEPMSQIQDQIGARVVTFYLADVEAVAGRIRKYMNPIEIKTLVPDSESEFGYVGQHFILLLPTDVSAKIPEADALLPPFFELQVKTLFQHAWAEANHDLLYKPVFALSADQRRKVAFTAAQSWGADMIFEELHQTGART